MANPGSPHHAGGESSVFSRFTHALNNAYKKLLGSFESQIKYGRTAVEMPAYPIVPMDRFVVGCTTGPNGGLCQLSPELDHPPHEEDTPTAGITNWERRQPVADGDSITLYEHKAGNNSNHHGDPIADVYSVVLHPNGCILAVADGVNWGIKPRLAARCAVHGVMDHLNRSLHSQISIPQTTQDIFHCILRSFDSGQRLIIERGGTTTTLCVGVVVELRDHKGSSQWGLCIVSVGDTLCYVWRDDVQMVYEVTSAVHAGKERNPRDCGGCLGCNLGDQPDLSNLLCSFVPLNNNDIVFVVSDGVSDNIDPVILREGMAEASSLSPTHIEPLLPHLPPHEQKDQKCGAVPSPPGTSNGSNVSLPILSPEQRQTLSLVKLTGVLKEKLQSSKSALDAQLVNDAVITYVIEATEMKRGYLERCWQELDKPDLTAAERRANDRKIGHHIKTLPGKLDHATIASYKVGRVELGGDLRSKSPTHSHVMKKAEHQMRKKSHSQGGSVFYGGAVNWGGSALETKKGRGKGRKMKNKSKSLDIDAVTAAGSKPARAPLMKAETVTEDTEEPTAENPNTEEELTTGLSKAHLKYESFTGACAAEENKNSEGDDG